MPISCVEVFASEKQARIGVRGLAPGVRRFRPLANVVRCVEHDLCAVQPKSDPATVIAGSGSAKNGEAEHVAVKVQRSRHVENFQQWRDAINIHKKMIAPESVAKYSRADRPLPAGAFDLGALEGSAISTIPIPDLTPFHPLG
jgi:hypothetical protein